MIAKNDFFIKKIVPEDISIEIKMADYKKIKTSIVNLTAKDFILRKVRYTNYFIYIYPPFALYF